MLDQAFDLRRRFWPISAIDESMVATARRHNAGAALAGSGGSIVAVPRSDARCAELMAAFDGIGVASIRPRVHPRTAPAESAGT